MAARAIGKALTCAAVVALLLVTAGGLRAARADEAAPAAAPAAPAAKDDGWQQVNTQMVQPGETLPARNLVGAAYGFIWLMVAGFVWTVWRRADRLEKEIEALRAQVRQAAERGGSAGGPGASR
jgi:CcmD family protein